MNSAPENSGEVSGRRTLSRRARTVIAALVILAAGVVIVLVATSSGGGGSDPAACKSAMRHQFTYGMQHPDAPTGSKPGACKGISDADLQRFASEIMKDYTNGGS